MATQIRQADGQQTVAILSRPGVVLDQIVQLIGKIKSADDSHCLMRLGDVAEMKRAHLLARFVSAVDDLLRKSDVVAEENGSRTHLKPARGPNRI